MLAIQILLIFAITNECMSLRWPEFSWDTVPVFVHMCNASGSFNQSTLQYLAKFPMVTIEKGQGINATSEPYASLYAEDKILKSCQAVKEINSKVICIFYYNSILDWTFYKLHDIFIEHKDWWLKDDNNDIVLLSGDKTFPQPEQGLLVFDYTQQIVSNFWISECINMTKTGYIDGCFVDRALRNENAFHGYNFTQKQQNEFGSGHDNAMLELQKQLNDTNMSVMISNKWYVPGVVAVQLENFTASESELNTLMTLAQKGVLVQAHAGYKVDGNDNHCENITNSLASFLIGAEKYSYYGCSRGWYIEPDWINWHGDYDKPLGTPLGRAVLKGDLWSRSFSRGTNVTFNVTNNVGTIHWGS